MVRSPNSPTSSHRSSTFIAIALAIAILYFGRQIFIPLALAIILAFLLAPLASLLEKLRLGRVAGVLIILTLCFAITAAVGWGVADQLVEITSHLGDYKANLQEKIKSIRAPKASPLSQATATVRQLNKELSITEESQSAEGSRSARPARPIPVQVTAPPSNFVQDLTSLLGPVGRTGRNHRDRHHFYSFHAD